MLRYDNTLMSCVTFAKSVNGHMPGDLDIVIEQLGGFFDHAVHDP